MPRSRGPRPAGPTLGLFEEVGQGGPSATPPGAPLPARMRPRTFEEFMGQEGVVGTGTVLRNAIESDRLPSIVLWGPPGTGKTTLARLIASATQAHFVNLSAVTSGVADIRRVVNEARELRRDAGCGTILFIDEVHRFNKAQQDAILPPVEEGAVTFIGATTENPSFEVISPLLSRARVFALQPLEPDHIRHLISRALQDRDRGLGGMELDLAPEAEDFLIGLANGDARVALNALELAATGTIPGQDGRRVVTVAVMEETLQHRSLRYDRAGDEHYDTISAFIKSVRGSDPDAAVYWLARMLEAGEEPRFVVRRLVILAAEDIGLADPQALAVAVAAQQAVLFIGMPEGFLPLAEATLYLAAAPKSNSALTAYSKAVAEVKQSGNLPIPLHLRNAATGLMAGMGYGKGYRYAHDYKGHQVEQQHLPDALAGSRFYEPGSEGFEAGIKERLKPPEAGPQC